MCLTQELGEIEELFNTCSTPAERQYWLHQWKEWMNKVVQRRSYLAKGRRRPTWHMPDPPVGRGVQGIEALMELTMAKLQALVRDTEDSSSNSSNHTGPGTFALDDL